MSFFIVGTTYYAQIWNVQIHITVYTSINNFSNILQKYNLYSPSKILVYIILPIVINIYNNQYFSFTIFNQYDRFPSHCFAYTYTLCSTWERSTQAGRHLLNLCYTIKQVFIFYGQYNNEIVIVETSENKIYCFYPWFHRILII